MAYVHIGDTTRYQPVELLFHYGDQEYKHFEQKEKEWNKPRPYTIQPKQNFAKFGGTRSFVTGRSCGITYKMTIQHS